MQTKYRVSVRFQGSAQSLRTEPMALDLALETLEAYLRLKTGKVIAAKIIVVEAGDS